MTFLEARLTFPVTGAERMGFTSAEPASSERSAIGRWMETPTRLSSGSGVDANAEHAVYVGSNVVSQLLHGDAGAGSARLVTQFRIGLGADNEGGDRIGYLLGVAVGDHVLYVQDSSPPDAWAEYALTAAPAIADNERSADLSVRWVADNLGPANGVSGAGRRFGFSRAEPGIPGRGAVSTWFAYTARWRVESQIGNRDNRFGVYTSDGLIGMVFKRHVVPSITAIRLGAPSSTRRAALDRARAGDHIVIEDGNNWIEFAIATRSGSGSTPYRHYTGRVVALYWVNHPDPGAFRIGFSV